MLRPFEREGLLVGATGLLGPYIRDLLADNHCSFRVFRRKRIEKMPPNEQTVFGDLANLDDVRNAVAGVDWVVYVPTNAKDKVLHSENIARAAKEADVRLILKTSAILTGERPPRSFGIEHAIAEKNISNSGTPWIIVRPSFFMQSFSLFSHAMRKSGKLIAPVPSGRTAFVDALDVAECVVKCLVDPAPHLSQILPLTGSEALAMRDVAELLTAATGRQIRHVSPPIIVAGIFMRVGERMDGWLVRRMLQLFRALEDGCEEQISPQLAEILGRRPNRFADFLERDDRAQTLWASNTV